MTGQAVIYRNALLAIRAYCENACIGGWRHSIVAIIDNALKVGDKR